ncbi:MAG: DNA-binding response regulator [Desulfobacteraceae bacterium 4572_35.1]|nr:MAG: DNA-binding response regulator [Desulfobacteraceae bacterium 4572_35.1]
MDRILIIDDDLELCELLTDYLGGEGFTLGSVNDGKQGVEQALGGDYDLVVLDVMLPQMNGFDVLKQIRAKSEVAVIMLTARGDDVDRIVGLELGADDYLPKPFNPRELIARIRAIQRRIQASSEDVRIGNNTKKQTMTVGDIVLCPTNRTVRRNNENIDLTTVEFDLLRMFLERVGEVVSRDDLVETVLDRPLNAYDRSIDVHVSALRKKLGHYAGDIERIRTIRGVGYLYSQVENSL